MENIVYSSQGESIDSIISNLLINDAISISRQSFIHQVGDLEYQIRCVNLKRDYDLWKLLFSLDIEITDESRITTGNSITDHWFYTDTSIRIKFKNQEDESLFLLSYKGYNP